VRLLYLANAASVHTKKWVNYFAGPEHEVHLATWRAPGGRSWFPDTVRVHRLMCPPHHALRYGALLEVIRIVREVRPDLVHAHYLSHFGIVCGLLTRFTGFHPVMLTAWGSDVLVHSVGRRRALVTSALAQADRVTCDSPHMVRRLVSLGARLETVSIINFGVDTRLFSPRRTGCDARMRLGLGEGRVVVSLRNLKPAYDVATLIRAVPAVLAAVPETVFIVAGEGPERASLEVLARSLGVARRVRFVGTLAHEMLPDWLNSADVCVSTSSSDAGIAASTAEAMACGLPAIVTDYGDNGDWVRDGETGYLFPCGDSAALAKSIVLLLGDEPGRRRLGANARREIERRDNYQTEMTKVERMYMGLIERSGR